MVFSISDSTDRTEKVNILEKVIISIRERLHSLQSDSSQSEQLKLIFEGNWSNDLLDKVLSDIQAGQEPQVEVVEDGQLNALGAYGMATNTIYLSRRLLEQAVNDPSLLVSVVLEELGHYIDSKLNAADSTGDEGQLFSLLMQQGFLSQSQLTTLKQQSDQGEITVDGQSIAVEFARDSYGVIDNIGDFGLGNQFVGDLRAAVNGDGSVTFTGPALQSALPQNISGLPGNTGSGLTRAFATPYQGLNRRFFTKNADRSYSSTNSADKSVLRLLGDHYELTEEDGTTVVLRADGRLNYLQNRNGFRITANYDAVSGQLKSLMGSDGDSLTFHYNAQGQIDGITDRANQQTTFTYSANGQLLTGINDPSYQVSYSYESPYSQTLVTKASYASGPTFVFDYDANGRLQQQLVGDGQQQLIYRYDTNGNYTITDGTGAQTRFEYLSGGQVVQVTGPVGRVTQSSYDANGLLDKVTGPLGFQLDYNFYKCGELRSLVDALGNTTRYTYTTSGKLASVIDSRNNSLSFG